MVLRWDAAAIEACTRELQSEIFILKTELQTLTIENRVLRNNICLLSEEIKNRGGPSEATNLVSEEACADLRRILKNKAAPKAVPSK